MSRRYLLMVVVLLVVGFSVGGCNESSTHPTPTLSYQGHENDSDSQYLVQAYPAVAGTRLDDCQTCHRVGEVTDDGGRTSQLNPCSYCHLIPYPDESLVSGVPGSYEATLNAFGLAYLNAGRSIYALYSISEGDADEDGYDNAAELNALRYPGDAASVPGQENAPMVTLDLSEMMALTAHDQFLLMNSHKQEFDNYARYVGVTIANLLAETGVDLTGATSVTFIAPDGYAKDFELDTVSAQYPAGLYFPNLDTGSFTDPAQAFVEYPPEDQIPAGLGEGDPIPGEQWMMIAYRRDGLALDPSYLDPVSGKLNGEGPYRLIVPQAVPGSPDRGSRYSPSGYEDGDDYDEGKDHNAGLCVRGLVAIRVNPMPEGYEEFDWKNGGLALLERQQLIVYGTGVTGE